jgi:hypothetical protein
MRDKLVMLLFALFGKELNIYIPDNTIHNTIQKRP